MKKFLEALLLKVNGLHCIVISDVDGVPIVKANTDRVPETALRPSFLSTFSLASHQGSKLGIGENKSVICLYSSFQVVQMAEQSFFVTLVANENCNTGILLALRQELQPLLAELRKVMKEPMA